MLSHRCEFIVDRLESRRLLAGGGTQLLAQFAATDSNTQFVASAQLKDRIFLAGDRIDTNEKLWATNPASQTPTLLFTSSHAFASSMGITQLQTVGDKVYFFANANGGDSLYSSDGTLAGTTIVKTLRSGSNNVLPKQSFVLNGKLYFFHVNNLWSSDGTTAGTAQVWEGQAGIVQSVSSAINGNVFFGGSGKLWRTDGTANGTSLVFSSGLSTNSYPTGFAVANQRLFFTFALAQASLYTANLDGTNAAPLSLPSSTGEAMFAMTLPLNVIGNRVVFTATTSQSSIQQILSTDGTASGTVQVGGSTSASVRVELSLVERIDANRLVYIANGPGAAPTGLFATDGTVDGTQKILPTRLDPTSSSIFSANGYAFVRAPGSNFLYYRTDGSVTGTRLVRYMPTRYLTAGGKLNAVRADGFVLAAVDVETKKPVVYLFDAFTSTGSITGQTIFDLNQNGTFESFEQTSGFIYVDVNGNQQRDLGELSAPATSINEPYLFDGLALDTYTICITDDIDITTPSSKFYQFALQPDDALTGRDFLKNPTPVAWGRVFRDSNGNGSVDAGEPGLGSQTVFIDYNDNLLADAGEPVTTTSSDGSYGFIRPSAGTFPVRVARFDGLLQTLPASGAAHSATISPNGITQIGDFALAAKPPGTLVGAVWNDWNHDGIHDADDTPFADATVFIDINNDGIRSPGEEQATTNAVGKYTFIQQVPGQYYVRPLLTASQVQTSPDAGAAQSVVVVSSATRIVGDLLVYDPKSVAPTGRISGSVWSDRNSNGVHDADELNAIDLSVFIDSDADGVLGSFDRVGQTDGNGEYSFGNTAAGSYKVYLSLPAGWSQTYPTSPNYLLATLANGQQLQLAQAGAHSSDGVAPTLMSKSLVAIDEAEADFDFSEPVSLVGSAPSVTVSNVLTGQTIPGAALRVFARGLRVMVTFPGLESGRPSAGVYLATLPAGLVRDYAGNVLDSVNVFKFAIAGDHERIQIGSGVGVLKLESLSLSATATLDLNDNGLILDYDSTSSLSSLDTVRDWINTARAGGAWTGAGITSTAARNANPKNTTLGVMEASDWKALPGNAKALFAGESVDATAVLVKYTYYGDTNFDGRVNFDDYSRIDRGFNQRLTGWVNGDLDGNGLINFDDYTLIDLAFNTQGARQRPSPVAGGRPDGSGAGLLQ